MSWENDLTVFEGTTSEWGRASGDLVSNLMISGVTAAESSLGENLEYTCLGFGMGVVGAFVTEYVVFDKLLGSYLGYLGGILFIIGGTFFIFDTKEPAYISFYAGVVAGTALSLLLRLKAHETGKIGIK